MKKLLYLAVFYAALATGASAQELDLPQEALKDEAALARTMPQLAERAIAVYQEPDRIRYLDSLFRMQSIAGRHADAVAALENLADLQRAKDPMSALALLPFDTLAKARAERDQAGTPLEAAFEREFREAFGRLDDVSASKALYWFGGDLSRARADFRSALDRQQGKDKIALADAVGLIRQYHFYQETQFRTPLTDRLIPEDDARRYVADRDVLVKTPDGARIAAMVVRPKTAKAPLPALLFFTIYADDDLNFAEARNSAARGYAGVVAYVRGKGRSPDAPVPYERDGEDARAVIDWIAKQPWGDGRVGMYGGSYTGFAQWAAAKRPPAALKTIVPYVPNNPGQGLPMENNVFLLANYGWAFYVANNKYLDNETYYDRKRWDELGERWYRSGKSYRDVDRVDGTPNPWLQRWLRHPSYDAYWQAMLPYKAEFAKINIPVLTIAGYYDDSASLYFFQEHYKYNKNANHYLLIGPYDHFGAQRARKAPVLRGYAIDPVAQMDTSEVTYQWMDYVLRGGKKPELLKDRINYEVMGADEWKHAPSLAKAANETLTLYLTDTKSSSGGQYRLSGEKPPVPGYLAQDVDFADRKTTNNNDYYPWPVVGGKPDLSNGYSFVSEPFDEPIEITGLFSGEIKATINKRDVDVGVVLYEVMPNGELFHLSYFIGRASYARDMSVRRLLTPGQVASVPFDRSRMVSRRLSKGSRLLVTLNVNKNSSAQINYGSGKDVSDEDVADAKIPLRIQWRTDSYVKIPVWK